MAGWYELNKSSDGQYKFVLKAANGEIILVSELYKAKASAENGISSVQQNCIHDDRYDKKNSKDAQFYFNLKAANSQIIGTSEMYKSAQSRDEGINSVKRNGVTKTIKDNT